MPAHPATDIPMILTQFWDTPDLPEDIRPKVDSWRDLSGLDQRLFNAEDAQDFIRDAYGADHLGYFRKCALPAMKSDLFRVLAVYHYGGWYADCSIECYKPPVGLLPDRSYTMMYYRRWHGGVNNGLYAATPGNAHLGRILDIIVGNIRDETGDTVWGVTGPAAWNAVFPKETQIDGVLEVPHETLVAQTSKNPDDRYVRFHQDLNHKKNGRHWSEAQKVSGIFNR